MDMGVHGGHDNQQKTYWHSIQLRQKLASIYSGFIILAATTTIPP